MTAAVDAELSAALFALSTGAPIPTTGPAAARGAAGEPSSASGPGMCSPCASSLQVSLMHRPACIRPSAPPPCACVRAFSCICVCPVTIVAGKPVPAPREVTHPPDQIQVRAPHFRSLLGILVTVCARFLPQDVVHTVFNNITEVRAPSFSAFIARFCLVVALLCMLSSLLRMLSCPLLFPMSRGCGGNLF